jgi:hypothetical protein
VTHGSRPLSLRLLLSAVGVFRLRRCGSSYMQAGQRFGRVTLVYRCLRSNICPERDPPAYVLNLGRHDSLRLTCPLIC